MNFDTNDTITPAFVAPAKIDTPETKDKINQGDYDDGKELLPSNNMWVQKDGTTIRIYHPLKGADGYGGIYDNYYFDAKLTVDFLASIYNPDGDKTIDDLPENLGDYVWELSRSGGWQSTNRWTNLQNGSDIRGLVTKSNINKTIEQITPTWDEVLTAFGGYMADKKVSGGSLSLSGGYFSDTGGQYQYVAFYSNGDPVPTSWWSNNQIMLQYDMSGNSIPINIKIKTRCGNSGNYNLYGGAIWPFSLSSPYTGAYATGGFYFPSESAPESIQNPSGITYGCTIPTKTSTYPALLHVDGGEGNVGGSGATYTTTHTQVWELINSNTPDWTGQVSNNIGDDGHRAWSLLFDSYGIPKIFHDEQGLYVKSRQSDEHKIYLKNHFTGIDALYRRKSCTGVCPGGTVNAGQTITRYDTSLCDANRLTTASECGGAGSGGSSGGGSSGGGLDSGGVTLGGGSNANIGVGNVNVNVLTQNAENVNYILSNHSFIIY